jgi:hypothetical protein
MPATEQPNAAKPPAPQGARPSADVLAEERIIRPRAGVLALVAAVLLIASNVLQSVWAYHGAPRVYLLDGLRAATGESIGRAGLATDKVLFLSDHAVALVLVGILDALSWLTLGLVLIFLLRAAVSRGAHVRRPIRWMAIGGTLLVAISAVGVQASLAISSRDFAGSDDHSTTAAHDALTSAGTALAAHQFGDLLLAGTFIIIALAAMRVGLLTRFLGVLGIMVGALILLSSVFGASSFFIQALWLLLLGVTLLGRAPAGLPPAWQSGEAMPWPTQQELREARERAAAGERPAGPARTPGPSSTGPAGKRKRKRGSR